MSPSSRERRPRSARALDERDAGAGRRGASSRDEVGDREAAASPSASAAIGGAIGTAYQRWRGHTVSGGSPVASAEHLGVGRAGSPGANDCTGLRAATVDAAAPRRRRSSRRAHHVLPTSVPVPVTTTVGHARPELLASASRSSVRPGRRCARPRARRAAATCPARHRRRADRRDEQPALEQRGAPRRAARASSPHTTGTIGDGWPGRSRSTFARSRARSCVALGGPRTTRERRERGGRVGRRRRGREDVGAGPVHDQVGERGRAGDEAAERRRASSTACRRAAPSAPSGRRRSGPEHRVRLVEHEQRAVVARTARRARRRSATSPSIENTVSVTTSARRSRPRSRSSASSASRSRVRGRPRPRRARAGSRR